MSKQDKEKEPEDIALIYLQTFATPGGLEVLADLKRTFYNTSGYGKASEEVLADGYRRDVIQHIIDKMSSVNKRKAAEVVFNADSI
jgi:hypothetical protein